MKMGFLIDHRKCIGCHACSVACKEEHQVALGVYRTWVKYVEKGAFPNTQRNFTVMRCNHCEEAPCVTICPVTALYKADNGIVDFDSDVCIGCKACMQACPYDALYIDPKNNTAAKCNFCAHRVEVGLQPSCEIVCPTQAIVSGDLDAPDSHISQLTTREPVRVRNRKKAPCRNCFISMRMKTACRRAVRFPQKIMACGHKWHIPKLPTRRCRCLVRSHR